jgi:hypothetical protein
MDMCVVRMYVYAVVLQERIDRATKISSQNRFVLVKPELFKQNRSF